MKKTIIRNLFSLDQHLDLYFEIIGEQLECPPNIRKKYIRHLKGEIDRYLLNHPDAMMSDICGIFGDPYEHTAAVFKMMEKNHTQELRKRTVLFLALVVVLITLLIIAVGFAVHYYYISDPTINFIFT